MGTHPIFESDFDCLTDMESKTKTLLGELRAQRQKWQNITLLTIEKNEKISPKLFISAEELCDSGTSSGESEHFFISVHEKYINEDAEKRELRQKIEKHRQKFIEIYASYPELAITGRLMKNYVKCVRSSHAKLMYVFGNFIRKAITIGLKGIEIRRSIIGYIG